MTTYIWSVIEICFPKVAADDLISTSFPNLSLGIYQVLEYMGGGDFLNPSIERDVFKENFTRFYVAEVVHHCQGYLGFLIDFLKMILAIESCHRHGFIHCYIKPDVSPFIICP